jgi:hypothetical protein
MNPSPMPGTTGTGAAGAAAGSSAPGPPGGAAQEAPFSLKPVYVLIFTLLFLGGLLFASMSLQLTSDMGFRDALTKVIRRIFRWVGVPLDGWASTSVVFSAIGLVAAAP